MTCRGLLSQYMQGKILHDDKGNGYKVFCYIPNPTKNRALCKKWIHNIGNKNLDLDHFHTLISKNGG